MPKPHPPTAPPAPAPASRRTSARRPQPSLLLQYPQILQIVQLFDHLEDVMAFVKDRHGRFCWVNRAIRLTQGRDDGAQFILGKTDQDLAPPDLAAKYRLDDEQVLAGRPIVNRVELFRRADGVTGWHVTNKVPLFDRRGRIVGTAGIAQWLRTRELDLHPGQLFAPVLAHLRDHYQRPVTNAQLARLTHLSVRAFERRFRASFHLSPQRYLKHLRLRLAAHAFAYTSQLLREVAAHCGFASQSHFTREFHRHFGRTPREYRAHFGPK